MRIEVTHDDIVNGKRWSGRKCPMAIAVQRHTGLEVSVSILDIILSNPFTIMGEMVSEIKIPLGENERKFIASFDDSNWACPIEFNLSAEHFVCSDVKGAGKL